MTTTISDSRAKVEANAWLKRYYFTGAGFAIVGVGLQSEWPATIPPSVPSVF